PDNDLRALLLREGVLILRDCLAGHADLGGPALRAAGEKHLAAGQRPRVAGVLVRRGAAGPVAAVWPPHDEDGAGGDGEYRQADGQHPLACAPPRRRCPMVLGHGLSLTRSGARAVNSAPGKRKVFPLTLVYLTRPS